MGGSWWGLRECWRGRGGLIKDEKEERVACWGEFWGHCFGDVLALGEMKEVVQPVSETWTEVYVKGLRKIIAKRESRRASGFIGEPWAFWVGIF